MKDSVFREYDIRGIVGEELNLDQVYKLGCAIAYYFAQHNPELKTVVVGRDARSHSPLIKKELFRALTDAGLTVLNVGICSSPVIYFGLHTQKIDAGIMITASHNPSAYNGLKICLGTTSLSGEAIREIRTLYKQNKKLEKLEQLTKQFEKRKSHYHNFLAQGNLAKNELDQLKQKMLLADDDDAPSCSLCEQNLSASRKRFLKQKFITTKQFLLHRLHKLKKIVVELKQLLTNDHETLEMYRKKREEHTLLQVKINQKNDLAKKITETFSANEKQCSHYNTIEIKQKKHSAQLKIELQEITHNTTELLKKNTSYLELSKQLEKLQKELVTAPYNAQEHQVIQKELEIIEKKITDYADIQKQITQQGERKKTIDKLSKQLKQIDTEKCTIIKQIDQYKTLPEQEKKIRASKLDIDERYKKIKEEKNLMLEERGGLTTKTKMLEQIEKEYHQHKKTFSTLEKTKKNYQAIALAAGKDGIQALLIEDAIPEIEQEANELLSKLTNNQSQIILESLRDLKKGGIKETLDIKISDTSGIRAYELFSGGEAFRIDFALRVAISKLLARRAGTSLQTLIIDEGFGSQDEEGLSNIMDALHKIQDDFSKIIIVSHLTTMKDQFPVHFVVQKGPNGSTVNILEQG